MCSVDPGVSWHMNVRPLSEGTVGRPLPSPSGWGQPGTPTLSANHITFRGLDGLRG